MDLSVFLGALLGFAGGLLLDRSLSWWGRRERRQRFRSLIAHELVRNLTFIARIENWARETGGSGHALYTSDRPRAEALRSILTASEILMSLSEKEQTNIIELVAHVDQLNIQCEGASSKRGLIRAVNLARGSHFLLLALTLALIGESHLEQPILRQLKTALQPTSVVRGWWRRRTVDAVWASPPPIDDERLAELSKKPVVVWTRGASTYSGELIELGDIIGD